MQALLDKKIWQLYDLQEEIGYHDCNMFQQPLDDRLQLSEKQKMAWIAQTTKVSMETYQHHQTTRQQDIRKFFTATSRSPK